MENKQIAELELISKKEILRLMQNLFGKIVEDAMSGEVKVNDEQDAIQNAIGLGAAAGTVNAIMEIVEDLDTVTLVSELVHDELANKVIINKGKKGERTIW